MTLSRSDFPKRSAFIHLPVDSLHLFVTTAYYSTLDRLWQRAECQIVNQTKRNTYNVRIINTATHPRANANNIRTYVDTNTCTKNTKRKVHGTQTTTTKTTACHTTHNQHTTAPTHHTHQKEQTLTSKEKSRICCLLYTSDAADE